MSDLTISMRKTVLALVPTFFIGLWTNAYPMDLEVTGLIGPHSAQLSGLARIENLLILLPQKDYMLYWVQIEKVDQALKNGDDSIKVNPVSMDGSKPSVDGLSGWEAIVGGIKQKQPTLFLAHEDADGAHSVYSTTFGIKKNRLTLGSLKKEWFLRPTRVPNYAYESLVWLEGRGLLAIPELSRYNDMAVLFREDEKRDFLSLTLHAYRVSDASAFPASGTKLLATSFCHYPVDRAHCASPQNESRSRLLCLDVSKSKVSHQKKVMPLPLHMTNSRKDFNVEGVVLYKSGILVVNDNSPGNTRSTLRYLFDENIKEFLDTCLTQTSSN